MAPKELATVEAASSAVAAVVNAATNVYAQVKANQSVHKNNRELLRVRLEEARAFEVAEGIMGLTRQKFVHMRELFDEARRMEGLPEYAEFFGTALEASRLLEDNIRAYVRRLR